MQAILIWGLCILGVYQLAYLIRRHVLPRRRWRPHGAFKPTVVGNRTQPFDSADQLRHVMAADFEPRKVMNFSEYRIFKLVEDAANRRKNGCRVFSQTSLGEILYSKDRLAFGSINSKRADVLVVGPDGFPWFVVEYQGNGHHQSDAAARDAVKKEALRRAGVEYVEVIDSLSEPETVALIESAFNRREARRAGLVMNS